MFKKAPIGFVAITLVGVALAVGVKVEAGGEYDAARRHYRRCLAGRSEPDGP